MSREQNNWLNQGHDSLLAKNTRFGFRETWSHVLTVLLAGCGILDGVLSHAAEFPLL